MNVGCPCASALPFADDSGRKLELRERLK